MAQARSTPSDVAFSAAVKAIQTAKGSREMYARMEERRPWQNRITPDLAQFIGAQTSVFLGTASADGQPYIQHRGGPAGFLKVLDESRIGFADLAGNRQYITLGNLSENPQAFLFLIDYEQARRVKLWGTAAVHENAPDLMERLRVEDGKGRAERAIVFSIETWDVNCPQHIPVRFDASRVAAAIADRDARIAKLEAELNRQRY
ncbi:pyridoxamine 5'-phosphate oxidase family protein [Breoghania sp.]|uniref:pyridoxamine 5'-phosphate oxidase family protein n=1 Tax=Breoghania sp. TaxID=2065378 RepID=UPI002AA90562|nr:pyridoxamine 5'-phosphate oxidase family protein [Breoghania sp.]